MALKDWKKEFETKSTIGYSKIASNVDRLYIYKKGHFRGKEKEYVVSTNIYGQRKNEGFSNKVKALKSAREYMRRN